MEATTVFYWLALGAGLQLFGFGRWMTPVTPWLVPVFLLHFSHQVPALAGFLWIWFALTFAIGISMRGVVPIPGLAYLVLPVMWGLLNALPFVADRMLVPGVPGFVATLVFPLTWTSIEFLSTRWNPYGSWGASAYTQHGILPLMQLASVTGLWGIGFMIAWFAAVMNYAWEQHFSGDALRVLLVYGVILGMIILSGGVRIALAPVRKTVRVAGIGWPKGIIEQAGFMRAVRPDLSASEREELNHDFVRIQDSFLERSEREARAGAKIIVWPEANLILFEEDEPAFVERACGIARKYAVYILMGMVTLRQGQRYTFRNHAILINPAGEVVYDYTKITAVPGFEKKYSVPADKPMPFVDTEYGRITSPICFDMDFDGIVRQVGQGKADLMLVPASDWKEIMPLHQQMAEYRAIENGTALFRITRWGGSGAVDPYGRRLAWMDDFAAQDNVMVAQVTINAGICTVFARIGNTFGWLCTVGFVLCVLVGIVNL